MTTQIDGDVLIFFLRLVYLAWIHAMDGESFDVPETGIWPEDIRPVLDFLERQADRCLSQNMGLNERETVENHLTTLFAVAVSNAHRDKLN